MAPFGPSWFQPIAQGSALGLLREAWIYRSMEQDAREDAERRQSLVELGGFYANPELYFKVKEYKDGNSASPEMFKVKYDTSDFTNRLNDAQRGKVNVKHQDEELAALVRRKRAEREVRRSRDPRIVQAQATVEQSDTIEVEYGPQPTKK